MEFFQRITALFMSIILAIAALLGIPIKSEKDVQNVILLIGDGMGVNTLAMTERDRDVKLTTTSLKQQGFSRTRSASDAVTDSAAGATALACGVRTCNYAVGYYWFDQPDCPYQPGSVPKNITELCRENSMKTGIVTSDKISGATPAGFSVHTSSRYNTEEILDAQLVSGIDLIWGTNDSYLTEEKAAAAGYTYIDTIEEMNALTGNEKSIAQFTASIYHNYNKNDATPTLSQAAEKAIALLSNTSKKGFFLMIEGAHIDKKSANKNRNGATETTLEFDNAVKKAIDFAKKDKHTLVVVTADHETGGIYITKDGDFAYKNGNHSDADVPIAAYGPITFIQNGETIDNVEIPKRIANALEFDAAAFPFEVKTAAKKEEKLAA